MSHYRCYVNPNAVEARRAEDLKRNISPGAEDSKQDRLRGDTPIPLALLGKGRVMFFLEQEGLVKEFTLPSVLALLARMESDDR